MISSKFVFGSVVIYRLISLCDSTIIMTIEINEINNDKDYAKFTNELLDPKVSFVAFEVAIYSILVIENSEMCFFSGTLKKKHK